SIAEIEIADLQRAIRALRTEKQDIVDRLDCYQYPVLTLPTELVSEIFIHFLPDYPSSPPLRGTRSPNILAAICQKWRYIALSSPLLWRAISLDYAPNAQGQLRMLETWLSRSGQCPLSLQTKKGDCISSEVLTLIFQYKPRWQHVKLMACASDLFSTPIEGPLTPAPGGRP
ncbi:hypothetical protein B0H16DRAFT_1323725, partial [Mycena metata]